MSLMARGCIGPSAGTCNSPISMAPGPSASIAMGGGLASGGGPKSAVASSTPGCATSLAELRRGPVVALGGDAESPVPRMEVPSSTPGCRLRPSASAGEAPRRCSGRESPVPRTLPGPIGRHMATAAITTTTAPAASAHRGHANPRRGSLSSTRAITSWDQLRRQVQGIRQAGQGFAGLPGGEFRGLHLPEQA